MPGSRRKLPNPWATITDFSGVWIRIWRFQQADGGVYVQCNAISLTRDIPLGLAWLVNAVHSKIFPANQCASPWTQHTQSLGRVSRLAAEIHELPRACHALP